MKVEKILESKESRNKASSMKDQSGFKRAATTSINQFEIPSFKKIPSLIQRDVPQKKDLENIEPEVKIEACNE